MLGERKKSSQSVTQKMSRKKEKCVPDSGRQCGGGHCEEYGRCLGGEYVRSRQQVKALGMVEVSVGDPAALRGESRVPSTYTEGRQGFGPFVEERDDRVAVPESLRAPLRAVASSGCERDSGADASAPEHGGLA